MGKRRSETLDDLLRDIIAKGRLTAWCAKAGVAPWTLLRLRSGTGTRTHRGTVQAIADALGVTRERVAAAIAASRAAAR